MWDAIVRNDVRPLRLRLNSRLALLRGDRCFETVEIRLSSGRKLVQRPGQLRPDPFHIREEPVSALLPGIALGIETDLVRSQTQLLKDLFRLRLITKPHCRRAAEH